MSSKSHPDDLSVDELEQMLYRKKRARRQRRLRRFKDEGRLVQVSGITSPFEGEDDEQDSDVPDPQEVFDDKADDDEIIDTVEEAGEQGRIQWRWIANKILLLFEIGAVVGLVILAFRLWSTSRELNQEIAQVQQAQNASVLIPTATVAPIIGVAVLPSGHKPPIDGRPPEPGEAGEIPAHLLPIIDSYLPPPIPTPGPEQARRIQIPSINVDKPIVQGDAWEQLKKGVGQHIGSVQPGQDGNIVLSAHNDIYGEIFRHLDKLKPGDEIIISTERRSYTYVIRDIDVVEPTDVGVMSATEHASTTLISCYPYLVNNKRIVVFADLAATSPLANLPS
jgi:sortase A